MKRCPGCEQHKLKEEFSKDRCTKDGLRSWCKLCDKSVRPAPEKMKIYRLRRHHITYEQWYQMIVDQNYMCANPGCRKTCAPDEYDFNPNFWHVDHDKKCCSGYFSCGKCIRGILCRPCNLALGMTNDSTENLLGLVSYLEEWNAR